MKFIRTHIISKLLAFLFALHIFNMSVDPPDINPDYILEDHSVNEMESITEIICEQVLHLENFFPEHDEHDNDDHGSPVGHHLVLSFYD